MAEAHSAVEFSFSVPHEEISHDVELRHNIWDAFVRSFRRSTTSIWNNFGASIWPVTRGSLLVPISVVCGVTLKLRPPFKPILYLKDSLPIRLCGDGPLSLCLSSCVFSFGMWFVTVKVIRFSIKIVMRYKAWIYSNRKPSKWDKLYFGFMGVITSVYPRLYSCQGILPNLPLPSLDDTLQRHLETIQPIVDEDDYLTMVDLTEQFSEGEGRTLQRWLLLKSSLSNNYVNDWWQDYVYLRGRGPIMVNSNYYGMDNIFIQQTNIQAARAANFTYAALLFRRNIDRQDLQPLLLMGYIPLCSSQYERMYNTCRIPGKEQDRIEHWNDSSHVAVYHKGCWYKMMIHDGRSLFKPPALQLMIQWILDQKTKPAEGEEHLAALTAGERKPWAIAREKYFSTVEVDYDPNDSNKLDEYARVMLHGKCHDRWFDKSFNLIVSANAKIGINCEHSWADAPVMAHFTEATCLSEQEVLKYTDEGNTRGKLDKRGPNPLKLKWNIPHELNALIESSLGTARTLANDVDMALLVFKHFGKGIIKKCNVSPDAFLQCALQMTYFQDQGYFTLTYEASMTRLFREGRTETVRSCTQESCDFVTAMFDKEMTNGERVELLRKSSTKHTRLNRDAMCGKGVDRHLFALYVVSRYLQIDSPFLQSVISEKWRLSTSQTPHQQTIHLDLSDPDKISAGGGFGPVADDGYGVSYLVGGENMFSFHISSKKSADNTNSARFRASLEQNLLKMRDIFQ